jgi:hypothetical protein
MAKLAEVEAREMFQRIKSRAGSAKYRDEPGQMVEDMATSAGVLMFLKAVNPANALLVGGVIRKTIGKYVKGTKELEREKQIVAILDKFITEPKSFLDQVEKIAQTNPSKLDVFVETWLEKTAKANIKGQTAKTTAQLTEDQENN